MNRERIFYGWWIVAVGMGISSLTSTLFVYGFSAFFIPWRESFGWSRALLGGVVGLSRLEGGLIAPVAGWFIDKYGPRRMMFLGIGMMGFGFLALSRVNSLLMLYIVFIGLLAIGSSFGTNRPVEVTIANWFVRRRGRAMGLRTTGSGVGGAAVFLFALLIEGFGWRTGAIFAGLTLWGVGFPLTWVMRHKPEDMGLLPDGDRASAESESNRVLSGEQSTTQERGPSNPSARRGLEEGPTSPQTLKPHRFWMRDPRYEIDLTVWQALRTRAFWWMALTYAIWASMPGITTVHIAPFLVEELEVDYLVALGALSFFVFASVFGRLSFGFLVDYLNIRLLMAVLLVMQGIGIFLFSQIQSMAQVPFYVTIFALPYGGFLPMRSVIIGYFFGRQRFGTIGGLLSFVDLPATVVAPIWVGWLADSVPGGYRIGFKIIAMILLVAAACILMARRPRHPLPAARPPFLLQAFSRR
jgi:sugar phosphate permease